MSEITDLTAAVKALTAQLQGGATNLSPEARQAERLDDLRERVELRNKLYEINKAAARTTKEKAALESEYNKELIKDLKEMAAASELTDDQMQAVADQIKDLTNKTEKYTESTEKNTKAIEEQTQAFKAGAAEADNMLNGFLSLSGEGARFFQILGNGTTSLAGFVGGLAKSVFTGDLLVKGLQKLIGNSINFAFELDRQNAAFKAATGAGDEFSGVLDEAGSRYLTYGINAADAGRATTALFGSFRDFTNLSESEQANIAATAATLDKFGVTAQTTGQILDQATKSLYMNSQQAEALTREAATLAISIGKPVSEVASDLASAAPKLAFYGQQMFDVFAQLERQSKATGLSVDSLLGVVGEKFDTFEGAGQAVGRLNAILGGPYLNSIDMLNAKEPERLQMIKEAIDAYGGQFDQLNKFEQKAFASAMGTDVDTLRRMLNDLDPEVRLQAMRQEELAKRAGDARDIMTKLTDAINSLIIKNKPLMDSIVKAVNKFSDFIYQVNEGEKSLSSLGEKILGIVPDWVKMIFVINLAVKGYQLVAGLSNAWGGISAAIVGGNTAQARSFKEVAMSAGRAVKAAGPLKALGAAGLAAGGAFGAYKVGQRAAQARKEGRYGDMVKNVGWGALIGGGAGLLAGALLGPGGAIIGAKIGAGLGTAIAGGGAVGLYDDAEMPTTIQMAKFNNSDTFERVGNSVVAAKPDGTLDKAIREASEKQTAVLVEAIQNALNVNVQIGDKQLDDMVVNALNSPSGRRSISPFYQGAGSLVG